MTMTREGKYGLLLRPLLGDVEKTNDDTSSVMSWSTYRVISNSKMDCKNSYIVTQQFVKPLCGLLFFRYSKNFFRDLLRSSVLVCSDEIKLKIFFAFVVLDTIAWLNRLGPSKFNFIYLFFCSRKSTIKI